MTNVGRQALGPHYVLDRRALPAELVCAVSTGPQAKDADTPAAMPARCCLSDLLCQAALTHYAVNFDGLRLHEDLKCIHCKPKQTPRVNDPDLSPSGPDGWESHPDPEHLSLSGWASPGRFAFQAPSRMSPAFLASSRIHQAPGEGMQRLPCHDGKVGCSVPNKLRRDRLCTSASIRSAGSTARIGTLLVSISWEMQRYLLLP